VYSVEVRDPQQSPMTIVVDGEPFDVVVESLAEADTLPVVLPQTPAAGVEQVAGANLSQVVAPMPGTILDIVIGVGDRVQAGQVLCALEAMKMKSPIRAGRGGVVQQVHVREGQTVDHGDLLFVVG
jgi:biotin carboxyl carrier protein